MTTTGNKYRGYDIVPMRQWSQWCVGIYPTRSDLPILARSTLSTMAPKKEVAVEEAKQKIDRILERLNYRRASEPHRDRHCRACPAIQARLASEVLRKTV